MNFSERLKDLRMQKGLSQIELAKKIGLSNSTISMYERGEREPDFETLDLIGDFFNVDVNYLLGKEVGSTYYLDPQSAELAKEVSEREELKTLFDAVKDVPKEDIEVVIRMIEGLKK